ncbi:hypothetical protein BC826DRAFT_426934 [Russula brevipes]|nr:hypothetical protein BC826DRAFT_426934 [Russula brevipes]
MAGWVSRPTSWPSSPMDLWLWAVELVLQLRICLPPFILTLFRLHYPGVGDGSCWCASEGCWASRPRQDVWGTFLFCGGGGGSKAI